MKRKACQAAFPYTLPICAGFVFLGLAYGIYMSQLGFSFIYPMIMSIMIFAGSMEFIAGSLLLSTFHPLYAFLLTLMVNARHIFYGIAMLDKYKGLGWKKYYLIYGMCDETFSINATVSIPKDVDNGWFLFFVTLLNQLYWVISATVGGILGSFLTIDTSGIGFVMTALFVVLFLEQWFSTTKHLPAATGLVASAICLAVFGKDHFLIPAMLSILILLTGLRPKLEKESEEHL